MSLGVSRTVIGVEQLASRRVACSQSLAVARIAGGHVVRWRSAHGHHMAPRSGRQRRFSKLLLLSHLCGTQERIDCHATSSTSAANVALARTCAVGDRRLAHQAVRAEGRRGGRASQPDAQRRPSHANRRKALRRQILRNELSTISDTWSLIQKHSLTGILRAIRIY